MLHSFNFLFVIPITINLIIPLVEWMHMLPLHTGIYQSRSYRCLPAKRGSATFFFILSLSYIPIRNQHTHNNSMSQKMLLTLF